MLEITVTRAHRAFEPGRHKNSERGLPVGIDIKEAENFRLRKTQRVNHGAGFELAMFGQFHHHFHAHGPVVLVMSLGHAEMAVKLLPHRAHGPVAHHGQSRPNIHARHKIFFAAATTVQSLVHQAYAGDGLIFNQRPGHGHARPNLRQARAHDLLAHPLIELSDGKKKAVVFPHEIRQKRKLNGVFLIRKNALAQA